MSSFGKITLDIPDHPGPSGSPGLPDPPNPPDTSDPTDPPGLSGPSLPFSLAFMGQGEGNLLSEAETESTHHN